MAWTPYTAPSMTPSAGQSGTFNFFRPSNSQLPTGQQLASFLAPNGGATTPGEVTNRTVKYDGGLTREMLGNTTGFLSNQIGTGFDQQLTGFETLLNRYGSLGGLGGMNTGSAVYRPGGQTAGQAAGQAPQQGTSGQPLPWGSTNPFKATF